MLFEAHGEVAVRPSKLLGFTPRKSRIRGIATVHQAIDEIRTSGRLRSVTLAHQAACPSRTRKPAIDFLALVDDRLLPGDDRFHDRLRRRGSSSSRPRLRPRPCSGQPCRGLRDHACGSCSRTLPSWRRRILSRILRLQARGDSRRHQASITSHRISWQNGLSCRPPL